MSEDRTAAAALAIQRYVAGLREELGILSPHDVKELSNDIRDMLTDAAREDPENAVAEMARLGEPSQLAGVLLGERGLTPEAGLPAASWWRLGFAAVIDVVVGLAAPILIVVTFWNVTANAVAAKSPAVGILVIGVAGALVISAWLTWNYWAPWRSGGRASTPGMAIAQIAVIKIGDSRTVASLDQLKRVGLPAPTVTATSPGVIASVLLALLFMGWAISAVSGGALDPSGSSVVTRYAGTSDVQRESIRYTVDWLYGAALDPNSGGDWPPIATGDFTVPPAESLTTMLAARYVGTTDTPGWGYAIENMSSSEPGVWNVNVAETPEKSASRHVTLTFALRVQWTAHQDEQPRTDWVLTDYVVK
ncbi:MAG TPA: hypothetical protein VIK83_01270 [Coriobacteriia bacterium]